jgi:D-3-phosphoglycerate dehydrogenase
MSSEQFEPASVSERRVREYLGRPSEIVDAMGEVDVLVVHGAPVTDEVLTASSALRLVCCARGGPVNVDLVSASERGIPVVTTPGKNAEAVADQTIAFLVMLARHLPQAQRSLQARGRMGDSAFEGREFVGEELGGRVLGLIGFGQVGRRVARRARAFGMELVVFDPFVGLDADDGVQQIGELRELLARSHFVSLHARATSENADLIGAREFALMRPGAYFVNTARETLVDEAALEAALASGHLAGAALDVLKPRPNGERHPLLEYENVIVTPHIGGATKETLLRGVGMIADEIERFAAGSPLVNVIAPQVIRA